MDTAPKLLGVCYAIILLTVNGLTGVCASHPHGRARKATCITPTDEAALVQKELHLRHETTLIRDLFDEAHSRERSKNVAELESIAQSIAVVMSSSNKTTKGHPKIEKPAYCFAPSVHMKIEAPEGLQLKQVQVVFRHGIRTSVSGQMPNQTFPLSISCTLDRELRSMISHWPKLFSEVADFAPDIEINDFNHGGGIDARPATESDGVSCGGGELTPEGVRQLLGLGRQLGKAYGEHLNFDELSPKDIYARTTAVHRTLGSLVSMLSGIVEVNGGLDDAEKRGPFKLRVRHHHDETMFGGCERVGGNLVPSQSVVGLTDTTLSSICEFGFGLCFGDDKCMTSEQFVGLKKVADGIWGDQACPQDAPAQHATKLRVQPFLQEIVQRMRQKVDGTAPRLALYSGHDSTVQPVATALGFAECKWIPVGTHIVFELWSSTAKGKDKVRVLYNGESVTPKIKGCDGRSEFCDLTAFEELVNNFHKEAGFATHGEACTVAAGQQGGPQAAYDAAHKVR